MPERNMSIRAMKQRMHWAFSEFIQPSFENLTQEMLNSGSQPTMAVFDWWVVGLFTKDSHVKVILHTSCVDQIKGGTSYEIILGYTLDGTSIKAVSSRYSWSYDWTTKKIAWRKQQRLK